MEVPSSEHPNCQSCKLFEGCKTPFMPMEQPVGANVLFVGESPGATEDIEGRPFVGVSGKMLRDVVEDDLELVPAYTNAVRCRPHKNAKPTPKQWKMCRPFVLQDIEESEIPVIVVLGATALKSVMDEKGIKAWRGSVASRNGRNYLAALHPAALLFGRGDDEDRKAWVEDMYLAADLVHGELVEPADKDYEYIYVDTVKKARKMLEDIRAAGKCAMDLEFKFLKADKAHNKVLMASFAIDDKAWAVPLYHEESPFLRKHSDMFSILEIIDEIALDESIGKVGHNFKIDCLMTKMHLGVDIYGIVGETMLLSQILDSRPDRHGLKHLANRHLAMSMYDQELDDYAKEHKEADYRRGGHYGNVPLDILWIYAAKDAAATWLIERVLISMANKQQLKLYRELLVPSVEVFTEMEANGLLPDLRLVEEYKVVYRKENERLLAEMRKHPMVIELEEEKNSDVNTRIQELTNALESVPIIVIDESEPALSDLQKNDDSNKKIEQLEKKLSSARRKLMAFNPNSSVQVANVLYTRMGIEPPAYTEKGSPSIGAKAIQWIENDWLDGYRLWKKYASALSKSLNAVPEWIGVDGRIRSMYNIIGARTGRTSSQDPNLQNQPNPDSNPGTLLETHPIKNIFVNTWKGGCLYGVDYGAIEMRIMGSLANAKAMIKLFNEGKDAHRFVASKLNRIPEEEVTKIQRMRGKTANWTMIFGGGPSTLEKDYGMSLVEAEELERGWFAIFPEILKLNKIQIEFTREHGYIDSPFGRRRYLPLIKNAEDWQIAEAERQARNHPIQSSANELLLMSLKVIRDVTKLHGMKSMLLNIVHDSILFDVWPGELGTLHDIVSDVMVNIEDYAAEFFPSMDFDWLKVPLTIDAEVGNRYGSMSHYGG